ncbi:MAG: hypothetical protein WBB22_10525 [Anaerolineae bacterium]
MTARPLAIDVANARIALRPCRVEGDGRKEHNPTFDLDEGCLPVGVAILAEAALRLLRE